MWTGIRYSFDSERMSMQRDVSRSAGGLSQELLRELLRAGNLVRRASEARGARFRLSAAQWGILRTLGRLEASGARAPRMHELGKLLVVQPPSLSTTLARMERAGLVRREVDASDQRTRRVSLTGAGRDVLGRSMAGHTEWLGTLVAGLSAGEQRALLGMLQRMVEHLETSVDAPAPEGGRGRRRLARAG